MRQEEMVYNCNYLISAEKVPSFLSVFDQIQDSLKESGWMLELTGPWPPYHFAKQGREE